VLVDAVEKAKAANGAVHIMGLLSEGGVHSHQDHIVAMCELALKRGAQVYLHAFWMVVIRRHVARSLL
jgi:2,3-bisphosphoglycerate-independent phosphoglycerate mutase